MTTGEDDGSLWDEVRIQPIRVALPGAMVGYTLRAYRPASDLTPTEAPEPEEDPFATLERARAEEEAALDEALEAEFAEGRARGTGGAERDEELAEGEEPAPEEFAEAEETEAEPERADDEEVPVFLSHRGRLLLFGSPESLVSFLDSGAPHDLTQLDTWDAAVKRIRPDDIDPADEDTYELDLVVENLRGGHDAWDLQLLISAGEFARDIGWALRLEPVIAAMASDSPLDDLDEALRTAAGGGLKGMLGRRRLRGIGAQQASLGWRTIIGKISGAVDWRD